MYLHGIIECSCVSSFPVFRGNLKLDVQPDRSQVYGLDKMAQRCCIAFSGVSGEPGCLSLGDVRSHC